MDVRASAALAGNFPRPTPFGLATYPPGSSFGPRRMRGFKLVWIIEGDADHG